MAPLTDRSYFYLLHTKKSRMYTVLTHADHVALCCLSLVL